MGKTLLLRLRVQSIRSREEIKVGCYTSKKGTYFLFAVHGTKTRGGRSVREEMAIRMEGE